MRLPIVYHPDYVVPLPPGHRFPMAKFGRIYDVLLGDGIAGLDQFHLAEMAPPGWLQLAHTSAYVAAYFQGTLDRKAQRRIGRVFHSQHAQMEGYCAQRCGPPADRGKRLPGIGRLRQQRADLGGLRGSRALHR